MLLLIGAYAPQQEYFSGTKRVAVDEHVSGTFTFLSEKLESVGYELTDWSSVNASEHVLTRNHKPTGLTVRVFHVTRSMDGGLGLLCDVRDKDRGRGQCTFAEIRE